MIFEEQWCSRCVHRNGPDGTTGCAVMLAHILFSYELCNEKEDEGKQILDMLIPIDKEHCDNDGCQMFHEGEAVRDPHEHPGGNPNYKNNVLPSMREWAKQHGLNVA